MNRWSVRFSGGRTSASRVTIQSGPSSDQNDVWWEWVKDSGEDERRLPENQQPLNKIWLKAINPQHKDVYLCVLFDGRVKKHYDFDGQDESHDIEVGDDDECEQ